MQLQSYAGDTDAKWAGATSRVLSTELIRHHYQFMARLQNAIDLQLGVVAQTREQLEQAKQHLLQAEFRMSSLSHLLKARQDAVRVREARREQRQSDEFAALVHARTRAKAFNGELL
jgi:flagellar FliJ protein